MATPSEQKQAIALARRQHWVVSRAQLLALGFTKGAIRRRLGSGRLHQLHRGVYAVGRPSVSAYGRWMAAVLACGPGAVLSHASAAALWELCKERAGLIEVSVPVRVSRRLPGIRAYRRGTLTDADVTRHHGIPVTTPASTLVDLATRLPRRRLERAIGQADILGLITPPQLRAALDAMAPRPGTAVLRRVLDRRTFRLTRSELERLFLPIAERAGLGVPETQERVNGFTVDFYWPALGLVVETDGLTYHRTPAQQAEDRIRDQAHAAAGFMSLRFTHEQVKYEPTHVERILARVARRLLARAT